MADLTPGHDPLDERIRATFAAERADIERRHGAMVPSQKRSRRMTTWVPLAVAAALLLIAGFFLFHNRDDPTAADIAVATQAGDDIDAEPDIEQPTSAATTAPAEPTAPTVGGATDSFPDDFANRPCTIEATTPFVSSGQAGSAASIADHIHNIRVEQGTRCIRVVVELGSDAFGPQDGAADLVPLVGVDKDATSIEITFPGCAAPSCAGFSGGAGERDRVDFAEGTVFVAVDERHQPYLQLLYTQGKASVTLLDNPARIVVDYERGDVDDRFLTGPVVDDYAMLSPAIQSDLHGAVRPANVSFEVHGFARPFEAMGSWFVFASDAQGNLGADPRVVQAGDLSTSGWTEGWGQFSITIPGLPAGYYIAAFGERPPSGDAGFVGSGQLIRIGPNDRAATPVKALPSIVINTPLPSVD